MNKNLQNIDRLFHDRLQQYSEQTPKGLWNFIESELNKTDAVLYKSKYLLLKRLLICAVFIGLLLLLSTPLQPILNKYFFPETLSNDQKLMGDSVLKKSNTKSQSLLLCKQTDVSFDNQISTTKEFYKHDDKNQASVSFEKPDIVTGNSLVISGIATFNRVDIFPNAIPNQNSEIKNDSNADIQSLANTKAGISSPIKLKQTHSFFIIPYFSIDHVYGRVKTSEQSNNNLLPFKKERPDMAWTGGILLKKELSGNIALQTGLLYSYWTNPISPAIVKALQDNSGIYKFKLSTDYGYAELKTKDNAQDGDSAIVTNGVVKLKSFSVPLVAVVNLKKGRLNANAITGASVNFIAGDIAEIEYRLANNVEKDHVQKLEGLRKTYLTVLAGGEINYSINKNIDFGLDPLVRYSITPVNKSTLVKTYPVNFGLGASLRFKL